MFVLDSHCDTPSQILRNRDLSLDNVGAHVDFPKLKRGGVDGAFFALYVPASMSEDEALRHSRKMISAVSQMLAEESDKAALATSRSDAMINKSQGLFSVFLGLENGSPLGRSLEYLDEFHAAGVRYITLCHSMDNEICDSCSSVNKRWNGLSPFGREVVREMNRKGILVDVSHVSDETFYDVVRYSSEPFVATHSCCRALADHPRNLSDEMISALASRGGVVQVNFYPVFLDSSITEENMFDVRMPSYKRIADHIDHIVSVAGVDHVGLGSDFDGIDVTPEGMEDASCFYRILDELRHRGYSETEIEKIAGGNFLRMM